tara:strand:- start:215 stop:1180 length:966 start_codon:yes stop_codon:yes gene_type:complete
MIGVRTPFRISFSGGSTDIPNFYKKYGGKVVSTSINKFMYHFIHKFDENLIQIKYSETELVDDPKKINHKIVKKIAEYYDLKGLDINSIADIPKGSGLGSSSAYTVGLINGLNSIQGNSISKEELAKIAADFEINKLKEPIGKQDQYASSLGGFNKISFNKDDTVEIEKILIDDSSKKYLSSCMSLIKIGPSRSASEILTKQTQLMTEDVNTNYLKGILELVDPMVDAIKICDIKEIGNLLNENWKLKVNLSNGVSSKEIDDVVSSLLAKSGIYGTKLLGAGGGGYLLVVGEPKTIRSLESYDCLSVDFENSGSTIIFKDN